MKCLFLILGVSSLVACREQSALPPCNTYYHIEISTHNYSMAYALNYIVGEDSLRITFDDGITGRTDSILFNKSIPDSLSSILCSHLTSFSIDTLKDEYINKNIEDGDRKSITLQVGSRIKKVYTANYRQDQLVRIYDILNIILNERYKIRYYKPVGISAKEFGR